MRNPTCTLLLTASALLDTQLVGGLLAVGYQGTWKRGVTTGFGAYIGAVSDIESGDTFVTPGSDSKLGVAF